MHFSKNLKIDLEFFLKSCYDVWTTKDHAFTTTNNFSENQPDSILQFLNNSQVKRKLLSIVFNTGSVSMLSSPPDYFVATKLNYEVTKNNFIEKVNCEKIFLWHMPTFLDYLETLEWRFNDLSTYFILFDNSKNIPILHLSKNTSHGVSCRNVLRVRTELHLVNFIRFSVLEPLFSLDNTSLQPFPEMDQ